MCKFIDNKLAVLNHLLFISTIGKIIYVGFVLGLCLSITFLGLQNNNDNNFYDQRL